MKFDFDKFITNIHEAHYNVSYIVYTENGFNTTRTFEELEKEVGANKRVGAIITGAACFSSFRHIAVAGNNRILFKVRFRHGYNPKAYLTFEERSRWVSMCKQHGLLPMYVGMHFVDTGNLVLRFDDFTASRIYLMLTAARYMQESPELVRATLYLRERGLDFFLALLIAARCASCNSGHSIFTQCRRYGSRTDNDPHNASVQPWEAAALKKYIKYGNSKDNVPFVKMVAQGKGKEATFKLQRNLEQVRGASGWGTQETKIVNLFSKEYKETMRKI